MVLQKASSACSGLTTASPTGLIYLKESFKITPEWHHNHQCLCYGRCDIIFPGKRNGHMQKGIYINNYIMYKTDGHKQMWPPPTHSHIWTKRSIGKLTEIEWVKALQNIFPHVIWKSVLIPCSSQHRWKGTLLKKKGFMV